MQRSPSVPSYNVDDLSSPDPLATSIHDEGDPANVPHGNRQPSPKRQPPPTRKSRRRCSQTSPHKFEATPSSPFRTISEQNLSPWKIRVTVEAEPEDMDMEDPTTRTMTKTMKIPLRQDSSPIEVAKGSSRGRSSQSKSVKTKRSGTPVRGGRNSSRSRRVSVTDLDVLPLGDDASEDDWLKQKRSPRKRKGSRSRQSTPGAQNTAQKFSCPSKSSRTTSNLSEVEIRPDTDAEGEDGAGNYDKASPDTESPELRQIDLNRVSVRPRTLSTKSKADDDQENQDSIDLQKFKNNPKRNSSEVRKVSANSAMSYPTPSPTSSYHGDSDDVGKLLEDEPVPTFEAEGLDTMLESEGFTMIDLETVPAARQYLSSPADAEPSTYSQEEEKSASRKQESLVRVPEKTENQDYTCRTSVSGASIAYPFVPTEESEISSTVPSSPPVPGQGLLQVPSTSCLGVTRKVTPQHYSSPKLPSPPKPTVRRTPQHQHRGSASALFAGIALQEVVSPAHVNDNISSEKKQSPQSLGLNNGDVLFDGFDSSTKRELRAGLRFGEELAKRQSSSPAAQAGPLYPPGNFESEASRSSTVPAAKHDSTSRMQPATQIWRGESLVQRTPVQNSTRATEIEKVTMQTPQNSSLTKDYPSILDTMARREREWQLERETVSRQIQDASESQVIVIDSDSEDDARAAEQEGSSGPRRQQNGTDFEGEEDEEEDIWLAEAKNSSSPEPQVQARLEPRGDDLLSHIEQDKQRERGREVVGRPRRSLIPSPWKRGDEIHPPQEQTTCLSTNADETSFLMFCEDHDSKIRFGAGEIRRQQLRQRRNSGRFDIDLMAGTPRKETVREDSIATTGISDAQEDAEQPEDSGYTTLSDSGKEQIPAVQQDYNVLDSTMNNVNAPEIESSPDDPIKIPVNFNDSSISILTPSSQTQPARSRQPFPDTTQTSSPPRPPTPRSALKGSRQSFNQAGNERPDTPTLIRKVVFCERTRGVDVDGQEASFSMRTSSDDSLVDSVGLQLNRELQAHEDVAVQIDENEIENEVEINEPHATESRTSVSEVEPEAANPSKGWSSWLWGSKQDSNADSKTNPQPETDLPAASSKPDRTQNSECKGKKTSIIPSNQTSNNHRLRTLPSYLQPPSYPSDPHRSIDSPLSLSRSFTNQHFRTLHIIYRKSLRPKFHAPPQDMIRPEIKALRGAEIEIDESAHGVDKGIFTWTVGDGECEVLERFMQECEFSQGWWKGRRLGEQGAEEIKWGWSVEQLAGWLCRIVVGEVVREEERKAHARLASGKARK